MVNIDVTISVQKAKGFLTPTEWICVILTLILGIVVAVLGHYHAAYQYDIKTANKLRTRCTTAECMDAAVWLMGNQNDKINPCEYFFDNACFNYSQRNPISPTAGASSVISAMREANRIRLHDLVSTTVVRDQWGDLTPTATMANSYYVGCIDQYQRTAQYQANKNPLNQILKNQLGQSWWVVNNASINNFNWETPLKATAMDQNFVFFMFRPVLAPEKQDEHILKFYPDESPSFRWALDHANHRKRLAFRDIVRILAQLMARDHGLDINDEAVASNIEVFVNDVVRTTDWFEDTLHLANDYSTTDMYNRIFTWTDFKRAVGSGVDWDALIKAYTDSKYAPSSTTKVLEHVAMDSFFYTRDMLARVMEFKSTDSNFNRKMNSYFTFRIAFFYMNHLTYEYNHVYRSYYTFIDGTQEFPPDWEHCLDLMALDMPKSLSALYVSRFYHPDVEEVSNRVARTVNESLYREIDTLTWMDEETKKAAKQKLASLAFKVGKPSSWADDKAIQSEMNRHYGGVTLDKTDHFGNVQKLIPIRRSEDTRKLTKNDLNPIDDWRAEMYEAMVSYSNEWNEITIPAGILQEPIVAAGYPDYMNYGGLGTLVAVNLLEAIDEVGQILNEHNHVTNWWTTKTWQEYNKLKQVIINYYNYTTPSTIQRYVDVAGYAPKGIRETGGVRQAYITYRRYIEKHGIDEQALPSLSHGDVIQNFFYAYASHHCDSWTSKTSIASTAVFYSMPTFIHVDGGLGQFNEFAPSFSCQSGSRMVPPQEYVAFVF